LASATCALALAAQLVLTAAAAAAPAGVDPRWPKALAPTELPAAAESWSSAACAGCHLEQARAHEVSGHAHAGDNFVFRASLKVEEPRWCLGCHTPLGRSDDEPGVSCVVCHAGGRGVLSRTPSPEAPHPIEVDSRFGSAEFCGHCHQFGFREVSGGLSQTHLQQDTVGEHARWQAATRDARSCADCHPLHAMGGVRRLEALKRAIVVERSGDSLRLSTRDTGHPLPTGDVMRWITLEVADEPLFERPTELARFGRALALRPVLHVYDDHRLPAAGEPPVEVALPREARVYRLVLHLVAPDQEERVLPASLSRLVIHQDWIQESP